MFGFKKNKRESYSRNSSDEYANNSNYKMEKSKKNGSSLEQLEHDDDVSRFDPRDPMLVRFAEDDVNVNYNVNYNINMPGDEPQRSSMEARLNELQRENEAYSERINTLSSAAENFAIKEDLINDFTFGFDEIIKEKIDGVVSKQATELKRAVFEKNRAEQLLRKLEIQIKETELKRKQSNLELLNTKNELDTVYRRLDESTNDVNELYLQVNNLETELNKSVNHAQILENSNITLEQNIKGNLERKNRKLEALNIELMRENKKNEVVNKELVEKNSDLMHQNKLLTIEVSELETDLNYLNLKLKGYTVGTSEFLSSKRDEAEE